MVIRCSEIVQVSLISSICYRSVSVVFYVHEVVIQNRNCGVQGGQILRNAISLSCILCQPISVCNIRAKRDNPGLR